MGYSQKSGKECTFRVQIKRTSKPVVTNVMISVFIKYKMLWEEEKDFMFYRNHSS